MFFAFGGEDIILQTRLSSFPGIIFRNLLVYHRNKLLCFRWQKYNAENAKSSF